MKELSLKFQLKFDEYTKTRVDLINESFSVIVEKLNINEVNQLDLLVFLNLLVESSLHENAKINEKTQQDLNESIKDSIVKEMVDENEGLYDELLKIYYTKMNEFRSIIEMFSTKMSGDELITSFSRLILNIKEKDDDAIEQLPELASELLSSRITFNKLARNSGLSMKIVGQPKFIIQRE